MIHMPSTFDLVHKPVGPTSFSIVQGRIDELHAKFPGRRARVCHGGTLDPFASGLLIVLSGQMTKVFEHLHAVPKVYEATVRWGSETDNGDPLGRTTLTGDASGLSVERLDEALRGFLGWHDQIPPATSNKRVGGERAYVLAHRGEAVTLPPVRAYLHDAAWLEHDLPRESRLRLITRGGYYVRALARDLGRLLGCGAHLGALRRVAIGPYQDPGEGNFVRVEPREVLSWADARDLTDAEATALRRGESIDAESISPATWALPPGFPDANAPVRAFHAGRIAGLLRRDAGRLVAAPMF
jgi:tRNA pseudouridine55 synthase